VIIQNPWLDLPLTPPYVLPADLQAVTGFNNKYGKNPRVVLQLESLPEPFIGDITNAKVLLLVANPGHCDYDTSAHREEIFRNPILANLRQERRDYPFYPLDPALKKSPASYYWLQRLKYLLSARDPKKVAQKLCVVEWHGYHSYNFHGISWIKRNPIPSQAFTFAMVKKALADKNRLVVVMRNKGEWEAAVGDLSQCAFHGNPRNSTITPANTKSPAFERILAALSSQES